jgi:hypothetical protein
MSYQYASRPYGIRVDPVTCFDEYDADLWWDQPLAVRDFAQESLKLVYYLVRGHIPLTSLRIRH